MKFCDKIFLSDQPHEFGADSSHNEQVLVVQVLIIWELKK
jgi:hypothetical protein